MVSAHSLFVGRGLNYINYMVSDIQLILVRPLSLDFVAKIQVIIFRASFYLEIGEPPCLQSGRFWSLFVSFDPTNHECSKTRGGDWYHSTYLEGHPT